MSLAARSRRRDLIVAALLVVTALLGPAATAGAAAAAPAGPTAAAGRAGRTVLVSGRVLDGSGHGWPLYAAVSVRGSSTPATWSDPYTGDYRIAVPADRAATLDVVPRAAGYLPTSVRVPAASTAVARDVVAAVDAFSCAAPGYTPVRTGVGSSFDSGRQPAGWSVLTADPTASWRFTDPENTDNMTGGTGHYAGVNSDAASPGPEDTTLVTPVADLSRVAAPVMTWRNDYQNARSRIYVDVTTDGGATWQNVWAVTDLNTPLRGPRRIEVPLAMAAGRSAVQARFHWVSDQQSWWWQVDDVLLGGYGCTPAAGGLVAGVVTDRGTGAPLADSSVSAAAGGPVQAQRTPDDPAQPDGFYELFTPGSGATTLTAVSDRHRPLSLTVQVARDRVTRQDLALAAPSVSFTSPPVELTTELGSSTTASVIVTNTGSAPAHVRLDQTYASRPASSGAGTTPTVVEGAFSPERRPGRTGARATTTQPGTPADGAWERTADDPVPVMDNVVGLSRGSVYSVGGFDGGSALADAYVYRPRQGRWAPIAPLPAARQKSAGAFVDDRLYVTGGWSSSGEPLTDTQVYHPSTDRWTSAPGEPLPLAASATGVIDGRLYVVGGCALSCGSAAVQVYSPTAGRWTRAADYPELTSWLGCGSVNGELLCAGGTSDGGLDVEEPSPTSSAHAYAYDPRTDRWHRLADLPADLWGAAVTAANGQLLLSTGVTDGGNALTGGGWAYDPVADSWSALPDAGTPVLRSGSTCGFTRVGGLDDGGQALTTSLVLPGLDSCEGTPRVSWLPGTTTLTVAAGASVRLDLAVDTGVLLQPGIYRAAVTLTYDGFVPAAPLPVTVHVTPPAGWRRLSGRVTSASCPAGGPLAGATVQVTSGTATWTRPTGVDGRYSLWLAPDGGPAQVIVAEDGWQPQVRHVRVPAAGRVVDVALRPDAPC